MIEEDILICEALGIEMTDLIKYPNIRTTESPKLKDFRQRSSDGEPLAYIAGHQPFMGLDFIVNEHVLIPRPETELLVEAVTHLASRITHLLEIGTGSGCIAVSLAKLLPQAKITATDISQEALEVAKKNAGLNNVSNVRFLAGALFEPVNSEKFDVIVSNPPYVPSNEIDNRFEPRPALDGGQDGLEVIRKIIHQAKQFLRPDGQLFIEIGFGQSEAVKISLEDNGYKNIKIINDYAGIPRIAMGRSS